MASNKKTNKKTRTRKRTKLKQHSGQRTKGKGHLLIIGGKEEQSPESPILRKFVELAGAKRARITIISVVEKPPDGPSSRVKIFKQLGAASVQELLFYERPDGENKAAIDKILNSTGIFLSGGNQLLITNILCGTSAGEAVKQQHQNGVIVGGTSAGASVMSDVMIVEPEHDDKTAKKQNLSLAPGMGLVERLVIDQHFAERGRINRILITLALNPSVLCLGIDENTGLIFDPDSAFHVIGEGTVMVLDGLEIDRDTIASANGNPFVLSGVKLHLVPDGHSFHAEHRKFLSPTSKR